jgi:hypothetical protein
MKNAGAVAIVVQPSPLTNRYRGRLIEWGMARGLRKTFVDDCCAITAREQAKTLSPRRLEA